MFLEFYCKWRLSLHPYHENGDDSSYEVCDAGLILKGEEDRAAIKLKVKTELPGLCRDLA